MPRTKRLHQLKRPNIRQDWSKWNLYNLSRVLTPQAQHKTFFQQKWAAKSMLRAYHNPDVREGTWTRMFDRRLPAVVPMDHTYLARTDGSDMAGGRGMGVEKLPGSQVDRNGKPRSQRTPDRTPYMHMTFHPLERRLDTAIFRALFASSTRQARQFVTHGWVKVNGKKMIYPSYQLNPGDMFSVDTERVMFATGAPKVPEVSTGEKSAEANEESSASEETDEATEVAEEAVVESQGLPKSAVTIEMEAIVSTADSQATAKKALQELMKKTRSILEESKLDLSGKRQRELRTLSQSVKKLLAKYRGVEETELDIGVGELQKTLAEILAKVPEAKAQEPTISSTVSETQQDSEPVATSNPQMKDASKKDDYLAKRDARILAEALERIRENPYDPEKPYATPWRPRDYMSAFAFIPRYLEVNQSICSAVYLRHPVARPGLAEVPTPYSAETMALGFNWYLRRR